MSLNSQIAEWMGYRWIPPKGYVDGEWQTKDGRSILSIAFDMDIALWHGEDGVFAELERRGEEERFYRAWLGSHGFSHPQPYVTRVAWVFRRTEPKELGEAMKEIVVGHYEAPKEEDD